MTMTVYVNCDDLVGVFGVVFPETVPSGSTPYGVAVEVSDDDYLRLLRVFREFESVQGELRHYFNRAKREDESRVYDDDAGLWDECLECAHRESMSGSGADTVYGCSAGAWMCPFERTDSADHSIYVLPDDDLPGMWSRSDFM